MERQSIKVLFCYFGQPRLVEECSPWHDDLINYLQSNNIEVSIDYHFWKQYNDRAHLYQTNLPYINFDVNNLEKNIIKNRPCPVNCNWYSYVIVDEIYSETTEQFDLNDFKALFSQTISKALACQNTSQECDMIFLLRSDLIFEPGQYFHILQFLNESWSKIKRKQKHIVYVNYLHYDIKKGIKIEDVTLLGKPDTLNIWFNNFKEKILLYEKNTKKEHQEQHYIAGNFANFYPWQIKLQFRGQRKIKTTIVRPTPVVKNYLKNINKNSYFKIKDIFDYQHYHTQKPPK